MLFAVRPADAGPRVAVTIKPVHSLVAAVMDGVARPDLIIKGAGSPHAYALKPSEAAALHSADLVFWVGPGLETFLIRTLSGLGDKTRVVALVEAKDVIILEARQGNDWTGNGHAHGSHDAKRSEAKHAHDAHAHDAHAHHHDHDPHIWLDPVNAKALAVAIADNLAGVDPANAALYRGNRDALLARLDALIADLSRSLAPVRGQDFLVYHDAYAYFEKRFSIAAAGAITFSEGRTPGARRIAQLHRLIADKAIRCVFVEPQFEPKLARIVTEGTSARIAELDPLGASLAAGPDQYFTLLRGLADSIAGCLAPS